MTPEDQLGKPDDVESYLDPVEPPKLRRTVRGAEKLKGVQPDLLNHFNNLDQQFQQAGITPEIKSGFRTAQQQNALYTNPATSARTKGNDGFKKISPHQEGRALDISFSAGQREKGRQIISDYAKKNNLVVPSDEPWHLQMPKAQKPKPAPDDVEQYLDPVEPQKTQKAAPTPDDVEKYLDPVEPKAPTDVKAGMVGQDEDVIRTETRQKKTEPVPSKEFTVPKPAPVKFQSLYETPTDDQAVAQRKTVEDRLRRELSPADPSQMGSADRARLESEVKQRADTEMQEWDAQRQTGGQDRLARNVGDITDTVRLQGYDLPKNHPDIPGKRIEVKFDHQPTAEEADEAFMEQIGKGYGDVARRWAQDYPGHRITENATSVKQQPDGSYVARAYPTQGFIDAVNSYAQGGKSAYDNTVASQQVARGAVARDLGTALNPPKDRQAIENRIRRELSANVADPSRMGEADRKALEAEVQSRADAEMKEGSVTQDVLQTGARQLGRSAQLAQNAYDIARGVAPEDDPSARAISRATESIPGSKSTVGAGVESLAEAGGAMTRAEALGGGFMFPAESALENAQLGPEAAYRSAVLTAPILAAGPISEAVKAGPLAGRAIAGTAMAAPAALEGAPLLPSKDQSSVAGSFLTGGAFPTEDAREEARLPDVRSRDTLGIERSQKVPDFDAEIAKREAAVAPELTRAEGKEIEKARTPQVGEPVSHPNPSIDQKPVIAKTEDGRVVVENPENKGGVSVVKHQVAATQTPATPDISPEISTPAQPATVAPAQEVPPVAAQPAQAETTAPILQEVSEPPSVNWHTRQVDNQWAIVDPSGKEVSRVADRKVAEEIVNEMRNQPYKPEAMSLSQAVRAMGGIKYDSGKMNRGELSQFTLREGGKGKLIDNKNGRNIEDIAQALAVEGYGHGDWAYRDPSFESRLGKGVYEIDTNRFMDALRQDSDGSRKHYPLGEGEAELETQLRQHMQSQQDAHDVDEWVGLLENEGTGGLYDKIISNQASEAETKEFRQAAYYAGISPEFVDKSLASAREGVGESVPEFEGEREPERAATPRGDVKEPEFVRKAREREQQRSAHVEKGGEFRGSGGPDTQHLIDQLIIHGYDLYASTKPKFDEWAKEMRKRFGEAVDEHLQYVYSMLRGDVREKDEEGEKVTGVKVDVTRTERERRGLDEVEKQLYTLPQEGYEKGKARVDQSGGEQWVRKLANDVANSPRQLTPEETGALGYDRTRLQNEEQSILDRVDKAITDKDQNALAEARADLERNQADLNNNDTALERAGREQSAAFQARKILVKEDYSLAKMKSRAKAAVGRELTDAENKQVESLQKEIRDAQKKSEEHEATIQRQREQLQARDAEAEVKKIIRKTQYEERQQKRSTGRKALDDEAAQIKSLIAAEWKKVGQSNIFGASAIDPEGKLTKLFKDLAKNRILAGFNTADGLVDAVHEMIADTIDITKRQVRDLISGYGQTQQLSQDEVATKLRELKAIMRATSGKADVIEQGIRPLRSGLQRDKPSADVRAALRDLQDTMRKYGIEIERTAQSPEERMKSALDAAKTATRNRIEDLDRMVKSGKREVRGGTQIIPDKELLGLRAERDRLQSLVDKLEDPNADQKMIERRLSAVNKSIIGLQGKVERGEVTPTVKEGAKSAWSVEISKLEKQREGLRKQLSDMRKAARPEGDKEQKAIENSLKAIDKSIARLTERIKTGAAPTAREGAKSAWSPEIAAAKKEQTILRRILSDQRTKGPKAEVDEFEAQAKKALAAQKAFNTRTEKEVARLEAETQKIKSGQGPTEKKAKAPIPRDATGERLSAQHERAKLQYESQLLKWEQEHRPGYQKALDLAVKWKRFAVLTYTSTIGKLGSATTGRLGFTPAEQVAGLIASKIQPELGKRAKGEGVMSVRDLVESEKKAIYKVADVVKFMMDKDHPIQQMLRTGKTDLDVRFGPKGKRIDKEMSGAEKVLGAPGRVHGTFKEIARSADFERRLSLRLRAAQREGADISDPQVQMAASAEAYADADRARLQQPNIITNGFNRAMSSIEQWGKPGTLRRGTGKTVAAVGRFIFPITRVPVNLAYETYLATLGIPHAAVETAVLKGRALTKERSAAKAEERPANYGEALKNAYSQLEPEEADSLLRAWKKGGVGLAFVTWGFLRPQNFGGYYRQGEKKKPSDPDFGEMKVGGLRVPRFLAHIPYLEAAQFGATLRQVMDKTLSKQDSPTLVDKAGAVAGGAMTAGEGILSNVPFYETPGRITEALKSPKLAGRFFGGQARSMIPGAIQEGGQFIDRGPSRPPGPITSRFGPTVKRPSTGFTSEFLEGVPGARKTIPISDVFGTQASKGSDEVQRLGLSVKGAVRHADETSKDFSERAKATNKAIKDSIDQTVNSTFLLNGKQVKYDDLPDDEKSFQIKQAKKDALDDLELPEKPEKPEAKHGERIISNPFRPPQKRNVFARP